MALSAVSTVIGSVRSRFLTSKMTLPLSVIRSGRNSGRPPIPISFLETRLCAMGITSTGKGNDPKTSESFDSSTIQTNFRLALATIFSRVSAPPPPLIRCRFLVASSAPSTYKDRSPVRLRSSTGIPIAPSLVALASELATAPSSLPFTWASASMK